MLKTLIKSFIPNHILNNIKFIIRKKRYNDHLEIWRKDKQPIPPPHEWKQLIIKFYASKFKIQSFVETGTYLGDMIAAQLHYFNSIYTIELGETLWKDAIKRFEKYPHVKLIQGDSGVQLAKIVPKIHEDTLFWLDGHYSEGNTAQGDIDCPIFDEIKTILEPNKFHHVLLIDDARCFDGKGDYPTIQTLTNTIIKYRPNYTIEVINDVIVAS